METIFQYGLQGVLAYGAVGAIELIVKYRTKNKYIIPGDVKLYLLVGFAFVFTFIPLEFGNIILEKIKLAIAIGIGVNAINEGIKRV